MTIEELNKILKQRDMNKIQAEFERRGFRHISEIGKDEFQFGAVYFKSKYKANATQVTADRKRKYLGTVFKECDDYEGITFIELMVLMRLPRKNGSYLPTNRARFTDAPINEDFERQMNSPYKCDACGQAYIKRTMHAIDDGIFCNACFPDAVDRKLLGNFYEEWKMSLKKEQ